MASTRINVSRNLWRQSGNAELYRLTLGAFQAALTDTNPSRLVRISVKLDDELLHVGHLKVPLDQFERVFVLGGGKATGAMAAETERLLGRRITDGVINVPDYLYLPRLRRIRPYRATHPYPAQAGVEGVRQMLRLAEQSRRDDLFLCLLSGGGSALMPSPAEGLSLEDKVATTSLLLKSGADIGEMNVVRRHLSSFKGGRLAERLRGSLVVSLVISDVRGDRFDTVCSGPTAPDPTTFAQARKILQRFRIWNLVPSSVRALIMDGIEGRVPETLKPGSPVFRRVHNVLIGSNRNARFAAWRYLRQKGITAKLFDEFYQGEATDVGVSFAKELLRQRESQKNSHPYALVAGGEATVTVRGSGSGGRDQELVLSAARALRGRGAVTFAALATDGIDGPTRAAGAIVDDSTIERGLSQGLSANDALKRNDSNGYFRKLGGLILTGPTGTNVNDVIIALSMPPQPADGRTLKGADRRQE